MIFDLLPQDDIDSVGFFAQVAAALDPEKFMSWEFWLIASVLLLIGEILTSGFLLGSFVPGTLMAGLLSSPLFGMGFEAQLWGFVGGTLGGLFLLRPLLVKKVHGDVEKGNVNSLVGQKVMTLGAMTPNEIGRVKLRSEEWRAMSSESIAEGQLATVVGVEGNTLQITSDSYI